MPAILRRVAAAALGAALAAPLLQPALDVGFLADDFLVVARCADFADGAPGLGGRLRRGATEEWSSGFQGFRPLTTGAMQVDHFRAGVDARAYKRTNLVLWLAAAAVFALAAGALCGGLSAPWTAAAAFLFAAWPPAVEPLCWTVIRQESLLCLGAFAGALAVAARGRGPLWASLALVVALGAKETGAVLPAAFAALDWALLRREGVGGFAALRRAAVRRAFDLPVLAAWWAARSAALGGAGTSWNGEDYAALLLSAEGAERLARNAVSLLRAVASPIAECAFDGGLAHGVVAAAILGATGVGVGAALRRARAADFVAFAGWTLPPVLLLAPGYAVGRDLESVRIAILPGAAVVFAATTGLARLARSRPRLAIVAAVALAAAQLAALRANMEGYRAASARVDALLSDAAAWPETDAVALRAADDRTGLVVPELVLHRGAYVLSSAWAHALAPPFRATPLRIAVLRRSHDADLPALLAAAAAPPRIVSLVFEVDGPRLRTLAPGGGDASLGLAPGNGAELRRDERPRFSVDLPPGLLGPGDAVRIRCALPDGGALSGRKSAAQAVARADGRSEVAFAPEDLGLPTDGALAALPVGTVVVWYAEVVRADAAVLRSVAAAVVLR
jgi:hypothetical protein